VAGVDVRHAVEYGDDPAGSILRRAEAEGSDLIVLGIRGAVAAAADQLGSVSSAVVRRTTRPVLLVPPAVWLDHAAEPLP
jgi:nucleotide-binding universal stress UspA family protein